MKRKSVGEGILPEINKKDAALFEEAFVCLVEFGPQTFNSYVSTHMKPDEQQKVYDVLRFFDIAIRKSYQK